MTSKFGMAGGIPERRVRPVWDAIDSRQFKAALKLSTVLLTKYPNSPYALALKALILERSGKRDEALTLCSSARDLLFSEDAAQIDDLTLNTLQIVFQRLERLDLATSCYEHACGRFPNNLEMMMGLFSCYVHEYAYPKQQQIAIRMYKIFGEERYLFWAVCSILLQVLCCDRRDQLLALAEGLIKKHIASHSLHESEGLLLYISVLEKQEKYEEALEVFLERSVAVISMEVDKLRMQGRLLAHTGNFAAAAKIFQKVLESSPEDWGSILYYLDCLMEEGSRWSLETTNVIVISNRCEALHLTDEVFDSRMASALCFAEKLCTIYNDEFVRGPYLLKLEVEKRCYVRRKACVGTRLLESLLDFFCRFGHLSSFTLDMEMFIEALMLKEKDSFFYGIKKICESYSASPIKKLGQVVTIYTAEVLFGAVYKLPVHGLEGIAIQMAEKFCEILPLSKELDTQENMHGEELLSLICNVLVLLYVRTRDLGYLVEAVMISEFGLTLRRFIWQCKILLVHLYSHLGAVPIAYEWYKTLDVKNILLETQSHHILPHLLKSPLWSSSLDHLNEYLRFMDDHLKECADLTFLAYCHRNYTKVIEFTEFKERLQHSHQLLLARNEASILQLKQKANSLKEAESLLDILDRDPKLQVNMEQFKCMTFNEDWEHRPWWSPNSYRNFLYEDIEADLSEEWDVCLKGKLNKCKLDSRQGEESMQKAIEKRSLLPRLVQLLVKFVSSLKDPVEADGNLTGNDKIRSEIRWLLDQYAKRLGCSFDEALQVIIEVSDGSKSFKDIGDVVDWVQFAVFVNAWNFSTHDHRPLGGRRCGPTSWQVLDCVTGNVINEELVLVKSLLTCATSRIEVLCQIISEPVSWHALVLLSCIRSLKPIGKRKKKGAPTDHLQGPLFQAIRSSILTFCHLLEEVSQWLKEQIVIPVDEQVNLLMSLMKGERDGNPGRVLHVLVSYAASARESEMGKRIHHALHEWNSFNIVRKIVRGQNKVLCEFHDICISKLELMKGLNQMVHA